jgi:hypothetical protein
MYNINNPSTYHNSTISLRIYQRVKILLDQVNINNFNFNDYDFEPSSNLIVFVEGNIGAGINFENNFYFILFYFYLKFFII